jgi:flagellar biosynthesis chaperone FliJ
MPKKKYPYQVVLDARAEKKREASLLVKSRREQLEAARAKLDLLGLAFEECRRRRVTAQHALKELSSGPAKGYQLVEHLDYVEELKQGEAEAGALVKEQLAVVTRAVGLLEQAGMALVEAARDEQAAEKHLEGWLRERHREEERAEQKRLDEIGSIFHSRRHTS